MKNTKDNLRAVACIRFVRPLGRWLRKEWHNFWHKDQAMCGRCGHIEQANGASWRWYGLTCHFPEQCPKCGWPNERRNVQVSFDVNGSQTLPGKEQNERTRSVLSALGLEKFIGERTLTDEEEEDEEECCCSRCRR